MTVETMKRQEDLDARVALGRELAHLRDTCLVGREEHGVLEPVDDRVGLGIRDVSGQPIAHLLALAGKAHVADGCHATRGRSTSADLEVVNPTPRIRPGAWRRQVHVGVDAARKHPSAGGVDLFDAGHRSAELGNLGASNADVGDELASARHHASVADHQVVLLARHALIVADAPGPVAVASIGWRR